MSLKRNILANYIGQIYTTLIGMVMVPLYLRYMGKEAYGLVGFFATLQVVFQLLDIGLTPTMARETARFNGGAVDALSLRRLLRALEGIFVGIAVLGGTVLIAGAGVISTHWLKVQELPLEEVRHAIVLMAVIVALRWVSGLYRGAVNGFERLVWLSSFSVIVATVRFALIIPFFIYVGTTPTDFFGYQLVVAVIELVVLFTQTYRLLPKAESGQRLRLDWQPLRGVLKFSLSIAFTSSVWVMVTQTDKLVLSKLLPLTDYAFYTLAVLVASGVLMISGPISGALLPRLTKLHAAGDTTGLVRLYRNATQLVGVIAIPAALILAFFAEHVLYAWTGSSNIAHNAAPILTLYALGNGILAIRAFPYYLQYANGNLRLHLVGSALNVALLVPILIWATLKFGALGAAYTWFGTNLLFFVFWTPIVHGKLAKGLHSPWLFQDIAPIALITALAATVAHRAMAWPEGRLQLGASIILISIGMVIISACGSSCIRNTLCAQVRTRNFLKRLNNERLQ